MGFWFFMLMMALLTPVLMLGFGNWALKGGPNEINGLLGYRTPMSMKNEDTWRFAHKMMGEVWLRWGAMMLPVSAAIMLMVIGKEMDIVAMVGGALAMLQLIPLVGSIVPVERALRKTFDKDGNRLAEE